MQRTLFLIVIILYHGIHFASDADGGSKVYEIPGYEGTITGYCAKYIAGENPKVKKDFKLK